MIRGLLRYELSNCTHSGKGMLPIVLFLFWQGMAYSFAPQEILSSFGICSLVLFLVMLAFSVIYSDINNLMIEQSFYIKIKKKKNFYLGKVLLITVFSGMLSFAGVFIPVIVQVVNKGRFFTRPITMLDLTTGFFLLFLTAMCAGLIGLFVNSRIFADRKVGFVFSVFIGILVIIKGAVNSEFAFTKYFTWLLPPIYDLCFWYCKTDKFQFNAVWPYGLWLLVYDVLLIVLYLKIMLRRKFD